MSLTRLAVRGSCRAGVQRLGDRVERADVFCAPSILIAGQDLVDDEATRHGVVAKLRVEANVAVAANDSRYTLRAQDGTLRHTSPDLKMYHSQIAQFVAQAGQDSSFTTTLINASLGVAVIGGFIHISLADHVKDCPRGNAKQSDAYKKFRLRQLEKTMAYIRPVLAGLDGGVPRMGATKSISSIEQKLLKLIESMPVLNPRCHSPRLYACA